MKGLVKYVQEYREKKDYQGEIIVACNHHVFHIFELALKNEPKVQIKKFSTREPEWEIMTKEEWEKKYV